MPVRVADASVIAAIAFREAEAERALEMVEGNEVHAPRLMAYEVASVARKKAAADPEQREAVLRAHQRSLALAIHWDDVDHGAVVHLALESGLSTYDASYLYLARTLGAPLLTFDRRLQQAAEEFGQAAPSDMDN